MVYVYTGNGYYASIIQTTKGNRTAMEVVYWARDDPKGTFLPCPIEDFDMSFLYSEGLVQLLTAIQALPPREMLY